MTHDLAGRGPHDRHVDDGDPPGVGTVAVSLTVDGTTITADVGGDETLLHTLRERLGRTAARGTCGIGVCGTCSVLVDGRVASSCLMLTAQARDRTVVTGQGLGASEGEPGLDEVQRAFVERGAYQCSFCIPAMAVSVRAALDDPDVVTDVDSIREHLAGNLCRCGTYPQVLEAVADLVQRNRSGNEGN